MGAAVVATIVAVLLRAPLTPLIGENAVPLWCGSFRDQCPTDSSNPAEDLALRVNRHSAYPVGAERIPYLSNRLLDGSPRCWTCIAARAASVPGNLPGS